MVDLRAALAAGQHEAVFTALSDLAYLEERCRLSVEGLVQDLAHVLRGAESPLPADASFLHVSGARIDRRAITILQTLLFVHGERLLREPDQLFSVLHDELYWHEDLRPWVEHARAIFEARPGTCWLQRLRRPRVLAAALPFWRAVGDPRALTRDGTHLLLQRDGPGLQFHYVDLTTGIVRRSFGNRASLGGRLSRDGARLVLFTGSGAQLWATDTGSLLRTLGPQRGTIQGAVIADDVVFTMSGSEVRAWQIADGTSVARGTTEQIDRLLPCGADAVVFHERGTGWWRWDGVADPVRVATNTGDYIVVAVSPAGDCLIRPLSGTKLEGWSIGAGVAECTRRFEQPIHGYTSSLAFDATGAFFAGNDGIIRDAKTGAVARRVPGGSSPHPSFDPRGRFLVTRHEEHARLWDLETGALAAEVSTGRIGDMRAHWSDDGLVLVLGDWRTAVVADVAALVAPEPQCEPPVRHAWNTRFSQSGTTLVVHHEGGVGFWDVAAGAMRIFVEASALVAFFAGGSRVLVRRGDSLIALATEDGRTVWQIELPGGNYDDDHVADELSVLLLDQHPRGDVIALATDDGRERFRLTGVRVVAFDRDLFVTRTSADGASVRSSATGAELFTLPTGRASSFAISPDHRRLAASDNDIAIWDLTTRTLHRTFSGAGSFWFREDSAALITRSSQTQQSGNQDWNSEDIYDVVSGACISSRGWWDNEYPSGPDELTFETASGEVFVATTRGGHVELFRRRRTP